MEGPYKEFCKAYDTDLPEHWAMIFHSSFRHDVPEPFRDRVFFSDYLIDEKKKPLIVVIDKQKMFPLLFPVMGGLIMATK